MVQRRLKPFVLVSLYLTIVVLFLLLSYLISKSFLIANNLEEQGYVYVSYEVLMDNTTPVISEANNMIIKPFTDDTVTVGKSFYDYMSDSKDQEKAIIYYENTYIQNSGIDYVTKNEFNCLAVLDGEVISITEDDIVGKTVKIRHSDNLISIYQSLSEVLVTEQEKVNQGQIIGISGTNQISSNLGNHLHFELVYKNVIVNPDEYFGKNIGD